MAKFQYKSFCWSFGTTSFRTADFNLRIESQLALLDEFNSLSENKNRTWASLQVDYYRFMQGKGFVKGDASNPAKDAREKTSGLANIGLIDSERNLTDVGRALLDISKNGNFKNDNSLRLPADSFIYLKQLLKMHSDITGDIVRPFVVAAYVILSSDNYLTKDEFTYLLPLCTNKENTEAIISAIKDLRSNNVSIDEIITRRLMTMDNYSTALSYFLNATVNLKVILEVGMNRNSGTSGKKQYDKPYFGIYKLLHKVSLKKDANSVLLLFEEIKKISNPKVQSSWNKHLFNTTKYNKVRRNGLDALNSAPILKAVSEKDFREKFFELMHLFKAKATLADYYDLNVRYMKTTDTMLFVDSKAEFDILPKTWLSIIKDRLLDIAFVKSDKLSSDISLPEIAPFLEIDERKLYADIESLYHIKITSADDVSAVIKDERLKRFNKLIDERFCKDDLISLFNKFESRDDNQIRRLVTNNADIPTIFEYILGITWYQISGRKGNILDFMNLSLEADLLPRTHAAGGNADIEYIYEQTDDYPAHCLLLEATLADKGNQRRMEMEPVSRHLGEYILKTCDENAYCVFVSTLLHRNVISDFRNRKTYQYYSDNYENCVNGLKILPLGTNEIKTILSNGMDYCVLYGLFETAYQAETDVPDWYEKELECKIVN